MTYLRKHIFIVFLAALMIFVATNIKAAPTNYCTTVEYNKHVTTISKINDLLEKWAQLQAIVDSESPIIQAAVKNDSRYIKMASHVQTVTNLQNSHKTAKDTCVLEKNSVSGSATTTDISDSEPVLTSSYNDTTNVTLNEAGSSVTTVTRTTTVTGTITRTITTTTTPWTKYDYDNGETETVYGTASKATTIEKIVTVNPSSSEVISTTILANLMDTTTTTEIVSTDISDSDPVITTSYSDNTTTTLDSNGSTVTTITRTTVTNNAVTRTTTLTSRPKTVKTFSDGSSEITYGDNSVTISTADITSASSSQSILSQTVTPNLLNQTTANEVAASYEDSEPTITTAFTDSSPVVSQVMTDGPTTTITTTSDEDSTLTSSYVDSSSTVDNGDGTSTTTVTRTTATTTSTPRNTRVLTTYARNTKTYSTVIRTTATTSTVVRTTTTTTTPIITHAWTDGTTTTSREDATTLISQENIVSISDSTDEIVTLVSDINETIVESDVTTTENIVATSTSSEVLSASTTTNGYDVDDPEYYQTNEFAGTNGSLKAIKADYAYARGWTGEGIKVGILDTGVRATHNDLDDNISSITYTTFYGDGFTDTNGHGTHVAGIIAAEKNDSDVHGVAYNAEIHSAKIGNGPFVYISLGAEMASQMADNGVVVANLSANYKYDNFFRGNVDGYDGYSTYDNGEDDKVYYHANTNYNFRQSSSVEEWKNATDKGMIIVNSAGNQGMEFAAAPGIYGTAVDDNGDLVLGGNMIIVGSVNNNGTISNWSNKAGHFCQTLTYDDDGSVDGCADKYKSKDIFIVAPGETINSLDSDSDTDTRVRSGTSMAAPHVTGSIAVLSQAWEQLSSDQIISLLFTTTTDLGETGVDEVYGNGLLNLDKATQPQGVVNVSVTNNGGESLNETSMMTSSLVGDSLSQVSAFSSAMVYDSYNRDYYVDLNKAVIKNNFVLSLDHKHESFGDISSLEIQNYSVGFNEDNLNNFKFGIRRNDCQYKLGNLKEDNSFLGTGGTGAFAFGASRTMYTGFSCSKNNFFYEFDVGYTDINGASNSIIQNGVAISDAWQASYKKNNFLFIVGQPLGIRQGSLRTKMATSINADGSHNYDNFDIDITPDNRHLSTGVAYTKDILHNLNLNMEMNYDYNHGNINKDHYYFSTNLKFLF